MNKNVKYDNIADEEIINEIKNGDDNAMEYLIIKYKTFVRAKARPYFLVGADKEDIIQEGMIGLYKAIRDYNGEKQASFKSFAELCILRQIKTAIKKSTRQKHIPLNSYISINKPVGEEDGERELEEIISSVDVTNPEELFINRENINTMTNLIKNNVSSFEQSVLSLYLEGRSYQNIAFILNKPVKSIDNALQRIKRKIEKI